MKTNVDNIARPGTLFIIYGSLKGYVSHPFTTLFKIVIGIKPIVKALPEEYPADLKKLCALMISVYQTLRNKESKENALSLTKAIAIPAGLATQMANFRYVEDERTFKNLIKYQKRTNSEGPTRLNSITVVEESKTNYRFKVNNGCCFFNIFSAYGVPELTSIFCDIDNAIFNVFCPDQVVFHRDGVGNRIADGAMSCQFICEVYK